MCVCDVCALVPFCCVLQEEEESVSEVLKTLPLRGGLDLCDAKHPWSPAAPGDLEPSWLRCLHSLSTSTDAGCPVEWEVAMLRAHGRTLAPESAAGLDLGTWQVRGVSRQLAWPPLCYAVAFAARNALLQV